MMSVPAGKACVNSTGVMVLVSMGRRVSHPSVAVRGRRSGYRLRSRVILCVVAACASGLYLITCMMLRRGRILGMPLILW